MMKRTLGNRSSIGLSCGNPLARICMQTGMPASPAKFQAGKVLGSVNQVDCSGMVLPAV